MIGAAGWRLFVTGSRPAKSLHLTQLTLNAIWPIAFFGIRDKRTSLVIIVLLDGAVATEVAILAREDRPAAALLVPYLTWSVFATALNTAVSDPSAVAG
jgi:benzodiazapine receptor